MVHRTRAAGPSGATLLNAGRRGKSPSGPPHWGELCAGMLRGWRHHSCATRHAEQPPKGKRCETM
eukprot:2251275-Alexandrium_andersonii.AAC.1